MRFDPIRLIQASVVAAAALAMSGCNVFSSLDQPNNDAQYLSAARYCFDNGDYACAQENYGKLSSAYSDTAVSEEGFLALSEQGASMSAYMDFVGDMIQYSVGVGLTNFANRLLPNSGVNTRVAIWNVYNTGQTQIQNAAAKNFVQFISATALLSEMLAEGSAGGSQLLPDDIATNPTACQQSVCAGNTSCDQPSGATLITVGGAPSIDTSSPTNAQPTIEQLYDATNLALSALVTMGASGKFSSATGALTQMTSAVTANGGASQLGTAGGVVDQCFRQTLLNIGVGTAGSN